MSHKLTDSQWKRIREDYARMYFALSRISKYMSVDLLRSRAEKDYGLNKSEAVEMAYENIVAEAKDGMRSVRKPFTTEPTR